MRRDLKLQLPRQQTELRHSQYLVTDRWTPGVALHNVAHLELTRPAWRISLVPLVGVDSLVFLDLVVGGQVVDRWRMVSRFLIDDEGAAGVAMAIETED